MWIDADKSGQDKPDQDKPGRDKPGHISDDRKPPCLAGSKAPPDVTTKAPWRDVISKYECNTRWESECNTPLNTRHRKPPRLARL